MTKDELAALQIFETRARQLMMGYAKLQEKNTEAEQQIAKLREELATSKQVLEQVQREYDTLKLAKMINIADADIKDARQRINSLVHEIDKCIAMLNL
ncbi:MAG: hypothetical protein SPL64_04540 [Bacteroidaceae bacterium]|nr:hypothetical protein [Bacteroidaceae bacterium]